MTENTRPASGWLCSAVSSSRSRPVVTNGGPLGLVHGAPLRLRNEVELGYKLVKWVQAVEFVASFEHIGGGYGGYSADHEFFGYRAGI